MLWCAFFDERWFDLTPDVYLWNKMFQIQYLLRVPEREIAPNFSYPCLNGICATESSWWTWRCTVRSIYIFCGLLLLNSDLGSLQQWWRKGWKKGRRKKTRHSFSSLSCIDNGTYSIRSPFQPYISQLLSALEYELTAEEMLYYALKMLSTR